MTPDFKPAYDYYTRTQKNVESLIEGSKSVVKKMFDDLKANGFSVSNNSESGFQFNIFQHTYIIRLEYILPKVENPASGGLTPRLEPSINIYQVKLNNDGTGSYSETLFIKYVREGNMLYRNDKNHHVRFESSQIAIFFLYDFFRTFGIPVQDPTEFIH